MIQSDDGMLTASFDAPRWTARAAFLIFIFPALGGLLFGYDIGATSYVLTQLEDEHDSGVKWWHFVESNALIQGVIPSCNVGGALLGSMIVFRVADEIGRRREMQIAAVLFILGGILEASAANKSWGLTVGLSVLLVGRFVYGVGCGFAMHGAPSYIAEMSPPEIRGTLVSLKEAMIVLGMLLGYMVGFFQSTKPGGWLWSYGASIAPAVVMLLGVTYLPPSARWLALRGRVGEARASVNFVFSAGGDQVLAQVVEQTDEAKRQATLGNAPALFSSKYRVALVAGIGTVLLQQVTGQPSILYYANTIFADAGMDSYAAVLTGVFKLFATMGSVVAVDKYGRRSLLIVGVSVMLVALVIMTVAFAGYETSGDDDKADDDGTNIGWRTVTIIICMFTYIGGYQIGFGPIAWLLISEIFPLEVRGQAVAVAVQTNFFWNLVVTFVYPVLVQALGDLLGDSYGYAAGFAIFAFLTAYSVNFVYFHVPETKGLTLEEIDRLLCSDGGESNGAYKALTTESPLITDSFNDGYTSPSHGKQRSSSKA